jgi:hypothetical protein
LLDKTETIPFLLLNKLLSQYLTSFAFIAYLIKPHVPYAPLTKNQFSEGIDQNSKHLVLSFSEKVNKDIK